MLIIYKLINCKSLLQMEQNLLQLNGYTSNYLNVGQGKCLFSFTTDDNYHKILNVCDINYQLIKYTFQMLHNTLGNVGIDII